MQVATESFTGKAVSHRSLKSGLPDEAVYNSPGEHVSSLLLEPLEDLKEASPTHLQSLTEHSHFVGDSISYFWMKPKQKLPPPCIPKGAQVYHEILIGKVLIRAT